MAVAVKFENVCKEYLYHQHITAGFKSFLFHLPGNLRSLKKSRLTALKGVSFEVKKGETFGIIGRNGSGKSTLLGLIAGVMKPDGGTLETTGKISSLLELGAGFHPDLSGMENILLNGILMGNTKEQMLEKAGRIVEFSELGDFIYQPLRTYSSGMQVRLGFSVAIHIDPEILLVDEALAVGDMGFQDKCIGKMLEFRKSGATIILVSHDMSSIARLCDRVVWIDKGAVMATGEPREVIMKYLRRVAQEENFSLFEKPAPSDDGSEEGEEGVGEEGTQIMVPEAASPAEPVPGESAGPGEKEPPPGVATWWDSPVVSRQCEVFITGDPRITFYDFVKTQYLPGTFDRGLAICHRFKGIETDFMIHNICRNFDVIDSEDELEHLASGSWSFREKHYDLVLCVDILHRIRGIGPFLESLGSAMRDEGVVVAFEYVGPEDFSYSDKDIGIAEMCYTALREGASSAASGKGKFSRGNPVPALERGFDIVAEQYFGGPLYDLLLDRIVGSMDPDDEKAAALVRAVMMFDCVLIKEGVLKNAYALIIARKKAAV